MLAARNPANTFSWTPSIGVSLSLSWTALYLFFLIQTSHLDSTSAVHATRSKYNEFCNKTVKCVATAWLACENEVCSCAKKESMVYDSLRRKCVVKAGETCKYAFGEESASSSSAPRFEYLDCVENSNCDINLGVCKCISNHFENTENGTCSFQKMADVPCSSNEECRSDLGLVCWKGKCDCDPNTSVALYDRAIYFNMEQQQQHQANRQAPLLPPPSSSQQQHNPTFHPIQHPHPHIHPHLQQRHRQSPPFLFNGPFQPPFPQSPLQPLQPSRMQMQMRFDTMSEEDAEVAGGEGETENKKNWKFCAGLPDNPCIQTKCSPNASCYMQLNEVGLYNATCVCNAPAFIPSQKDGTCKANFGNRCKTSSDCHEQFQCLNQQCRCRYGTHQVFDEMKNECKSLISGPCNATEDCVVNSVCDSSRDGKGSRPYSSCQCKPGYTEFGPGFCRKGYGENCNPNEGLELRIPPSVQARDPAIQNIGRKHYIIEQSTLNFITNVELERQSFIGLNGLSNSRIVVEDKCDVASRLECRGGKCGCEEEMETYDEKRKMCVGSVGAFCRQSSGFTNAYLNCVENAECGETVDTKETPEGQQSQQMRFEMAKCTCKNGYRADAKRQCVKI